MKKIIFVFTILLSFNLNAVFVDGNELYSWLESHEKIKNLSITGNQGDSHVVDKDYDNLKLLVGYLQGVADARNHSFFCLDDGVNLVQLVDIVYSDLKALPHIRHQPADVIISGLLMNAFPCPDTKK